MSTVLSEKRERNYQSAVVVVSVLVPIVVAVLLYLPMRPDLGDWVYFLPHLNGMINTATSIALIAGVIFIKKQNRAAHEAAMTSAFIFGAIFLVAYVIYHASVEPTKFGGEGLVRGIYFFVLGSHILLSMVVLPFVLMTFYFAWTKKFEQHRKWVKFTFPIWLYVSMTGVIAYLMISPYYTH